MTSEAGWAYLRKRGHRAHAPVGLVGLVGSHFASQHEPGYKHLEGPIFIALGVASIATD